jgi:hypothetical protein
MSEAEYNECQEHALELVDWMHAKTNCSHKQLLILGRAFCLSFASSIKDGVKPTAAKKAVLAALGKEIDQAVAFCARRPKN